MKRILAIMMLVCLCMLFMSPSVSAANDNVVDEIIDNEEELLRVLCDAATSFQFSITVTTSFEPSTHQLLFNKISEHARETDAFTGAMLYGIQYSSDTVGNSHKLKFRFYYYITEQEYAKVREFAADFAESIQDKTDYEKIKYTHDYIIENCRYNIDANGPYNCLFNKMSNCNGYALSFHIIMDECGIPCKYVTGRDHAWNIVELDGLWYNIDLTWDDAGNTLGYDYFLKGKADWDGHDKNTATAGFEYDPNNELKNWGGTLIYWGWLPTILLIGAYILRRNSRI